MTATDVPAAAPEATTTAPSAPHYQIGQDGEKAYLFGRDTPNIHLHVDRGLSVNEATRRHYPHQSIFLDGVYNEAPFLDNTVRQYSLDHHIGCIRSFTLATCEQAAMMVYQGLPLEEGNWQLYINEPDLDAVLSAWILMNYHALSRENGKLLRQAMPFIRLEGAVDAHGLEMSHFAALPPEQHDDYMKQIEQLRHEEKQLKANNHWEKMDAIGYTRQQLVALDDALLPEDYLANMLEVRELDRVPVSPERMAVLCQSHQGIYAVESELRQRYGKQLAIIVLDQGDGHFTLRQVDPFLHRTLTEVYDRLNQREAEISADAQSRWGGSSDIGGSPRSDGSQLAGETVLEIIVATFRKDPWFRRFWKRSFGNKSGIG